MLDWEHDYDFENHSDSYRAYTKVADGSKNLKKIESTVILYFKHMNAS